MKKLIYLIVITLMASCSMVRVGKSTAISVDDSIVYNATFSYTDSSNVTCFNCDDFVLGALDKYSIGALSKKPYLFLKVSKQPFVNIHNPAVTDTLYFFSDIHDTIQFYRAQHNDILYNFYATNSKLKLKGNINTGMTKAEFIQKFSIGNPIFNKVQIVNADGTLKFNFVFEKIN